MPFIHVHTAAPPTEEQAARITQGITRLMAGTLRKKAELTAVLLEPVAAGSSWRIGGETVAIAVHINATVTAGTNTEDEKAGFIDQAHALLREVLGHGLPLATYIVVTEVPGNSWGYAGRTQADRMVSAEPT